MKQQVFVIHGGNAFETHDEYMSYLNAKVFTLEDLKKIGWKKHLQSVLGDEYEVFTPQMPNAQNARYEEWKIYFEKFLPLLSDGVIFVGHSLGGIFLAKYFSENTSVKKIKGMFLVAAPFNTDENHPVVDFILGGNVSLIQDQCEKIFAYHSKDDTVVGFEEMQKYQKELPEATYRVFEDRQHFNQEDFPEIVEDIKSI